MGMRQSALLELNNVNVGNRSSKELLLKNHVP